MQHCGVKRIAGPLVALVVVAWAGCGDDGFGQRYPVRGTVTYQGRPVTQGSIAFTPAEAGAARSASGPIREDGTYEMTTLTPGDGVLPGKYFVTVQAFARDRARVAKVEQPIPGGPINLIQLTKIPQKPLVPAKYAVPQTSGLTIEVKDAPMTFAIELVD
jgi:hypothetical protein